MKLDPDKVQRHLTRITGIDPIAVHLSDTGSWSIVGWNLDLRLEVKAKDQDLQCAASKFLCGNLTLIREYIMLVKGKRCSQCGLKVPLELDHIKPRSHGRDDRLSNLQLLCGDCHRKKTGDLQWSATRAVRS